MDKDIVKGLQAATSKAEAAVMAARALILERDLRISQLESMLRDAESRGGGGGAGHAPGGGGGGGQTQPPR